jgi:methionyl-tRNA synthetase
MKKYITTAIPYVNGNPHIGHVEDYVLADIAARYMRMRGHDVRFQAGTDEHGNKIEKKAKELGLDIKEYVDNNSKKFQDFIKKLGVEYTDFIRTTDESHQVLVQKIWQKLESHIYKAEYEGFYCEGCERFVTENEYKETNGICPDHQKPYQRLSESNYYFRVSDFKDQIKEKIESDELKILPEFRKNELLKLLADTPDVSISRPKSHLTWGIEVPGDADQVMYVWMDALSNYITVLGYPDKDISDFWPASVQVVGKDILRFHAILWPAILLGLGLPLPKVLLCHGFILTNGQKMSKSLGNVIDPIDVLEKHGLNALRYYFARHIDTFSDSDFTWEKFEDAYNNELANDYGNLVQRLSNLCHKNAVDQAFLEKRKVLENGKPKNNWDQTDPEYIKLMDNFEFTKGINYAWNEICAVNKRIEETKPWSVAKENPEEAKILLASLVSNLLAANEMLKPFLPVAQTVEDIFTAEVIEPPKTPLFPKA